MNGLSVGLREHADLAEGEAAVLLQLPEIEHVVADRDADARREPARGEHAVGEVLDREVGSGVDRDEGAELGVVGVGQRRFSNSHIVMAGLDPAIHL